MAGGSRSELASSSPEGSAFTNSHANGQRGSYSCPGMERSGSFRESLENRVSSSGAGVARSPTLLTSAEISSLSNSLMLEPLSLADQKYTRYGELRVVLGVSLEEHPFGAIQSKPFPNVEELKHFKVTMQEVSSMARDRAKKLHESILKVDRFRNFVIRKRSRNEIATSEKSSGMMKIGNQLHQNPSDPLAQRLEERAKSSVPNKRIRSSMSEGRGGVFLRQGPSIDKDKVILDGEKNMLRACNGGVNLADDKNRGLPTRCDGWDKNMKRKRSMGGSATRTVDPEREFKQGMQQRSKNEPRPRISDGVGFRSGSTFSAINKLDGGSQQNFGGLHNLPKNDLDNSVLNERREHSSSFEKGPITKLTTKLNNREDSLVGSQCPLTKGKASRVPRTGAASITNSSSACRTSGGIDGWEQSSSLIKNQPPTGTNNRKRPLSAGAPSPHVAQWVGQRQQRIRMRRSNLASPVSGHDESQTMIAGSPASDVGPRLTSIDTTGCLTPKSSAGAMHQLRLENAPSPAVLSESEESGVPENKCKEKVINNGGDGKKLSTFVLPARKNKPSKEEIVDGRRLGRNGRGLTQSKDSKPTFSLTKENTKTKSMRNGRPSLDQSESKVGRPSKKVTDRKALTRPGHISNCATTEPIAECVDDHEELFAAANYVQNFSNQASTLFWKTVSPFFAFVDLDSIELLKQQLTFVEELDKSLCLNANEKNEFVHQVDAHERNIKQENIDGHRNPTKEMYSVEVCQVDGEKFGTDGWLERVVPLSQRLLAAIIPEYEIDHNNDHHHSFSQCIGGNFCDTDHHAVILAKDSEKVLFETEFELNFHSQKNFSRENSLCNGYAISNNLRNPIVNNHTCSNGMLHAKCILPCSEASTNPLYDHNSMGRMQGVRTEYANPSLGTFQYEQMPIDEKILLELQSIGLQPEAMPALSEEEDELDKDIYKLKMKLCQKARSKKNELVKLHEVVQNARMVQEKKMEHIAMDKLVEIAYRKFLGGRGNYGSNKNGINKVAKQVALAFAKRTLARCRTFESTGKSCFSESPFRNRLSSVPPFSGSAKSDAIHSGAVAHAEEHSSRTESRLLDPSPNMDGHGSISHGADRSSDDFFKGIIPMADQSFVKHETVPGKGKRREALLDDVVGNGPSRSTTTLGTSIPGGAKGKRSERERDHNKDASARSSVAKVGRPSIGSSRNDRKTKTKLKQKTAQISNTGILIGRNAERDAVFSTVQESCEARNNGNNKRTESAISDNPGSTGQDSSKEIEAVNFSNTLGIDSIEGLGVGELGGQVEDFWLNVDDDIMQDNDIMGLEIPMDDLTDLNMNF